MQANINNNINKKLEELSLEPSEKVWEEVEKALGNKKRRYFFFWWIPVLLLLGSVCWYIGSNQHKEKVPGNQQPVTGNQQPTSQPVNSSPSTTGISVKEAQQISNTSSGNNNNNNNTAGATTLNTTTGKIISSKTTTGKNIADDGEKLTAAKKNVFKVKPSATIKITNPSLDQTLQPAEKENITSAEDLTVDKETSSRITAMTDTAIVKQLTAEEKKQDTSNPVKPGIKKPAKSKWLTRITAQAGSASLANISSNANEPLYSSPTNSSTGSPYRTYERLGLGKGISISAGIEKEKQLSRKLSFAAGLSYNFSNIPITKTVWVDSAGLSGGIPVYTNIDVKRNKDLLTMHSLQASLLLSYSITGNRVPVKLSAGIYNRFFIAGNWNEYRSVLGSKPSYTPLLHLGPSVSYKQWTIGPYVNIGLKKIAKEKSLLDYGLRISRNL